MEPSPLVDNLELTDGLLEKHGDTSSAVGWFRGDADARYRVMLDLIRQTDSNDPVRLLDFGCGASHLLEYIQAQKITGIDYEGLDLSDKFLALSRSKHPDITYHQLNVLDPAEPALPEFDYVVMNGIFTYRGSTSEDEMFEYLRDLVKRVFEFTRVGLAFNVITKQVDWERDDLFHLPVDRVLTFLSREVSRHIVVRHDYGLYEYTVYVYRTPSDPEQQSTQRLVK